MNLVHLRWAGLDVPKKAVVARARVVTDGGELLQETRTYGTMTADWLALGDWLASRGVTHVAMESTGVSWKPVFHPLEDRFDIMPVNAQHIKRVPGRKTDVKDADWIAQLLQHGVLTASSIPPPPIRQLRDLTRQRTTLIRQRATVVNRVQKVLEDADIKLAGVASDAMGVSGRAMIRAIIAGQEEPEALADLAKERLRAKLPESRQASHGRVTDHHRFQLSAPMDQIDHLERQIARYDERIGGAIAPFEAAAARLETIPGVGRKSAEVIVAAIGTDMGAFPTPGHLASWAGLCPGNHESGGRRRTGRTTKGDQWLRSTLVQVAWAAVHCRETIVGARYKGWVERLGKQKALVAVAPKILVLIHVPLKSGMDYRERFEVPRAA
jgi:transposase